jgi:hypothetical protein
MMVFANTTAGGAADAMSRLGSAEALAAGDPLSWAAMILFLVALGFGVKHGLIKNRVGDGWK